VRCASFARLANEHALHVTCRLVRAPAELTRAFREQGWKVTPQRHLLFRLLHGNEAHPSAEALHAVASAQMPGISLRTVYQTLTELVAMGEVRRLDIGPGSARFDPNVEHHHHVVCSACGDVRDVYLDAAHEPSATALDGTGGFVVDTAAVVFHGRCARCAAA
jgi:Fe2+ or Zn2+ uptake regulation protein